MALKHDLLDRLRSDFRWYYMRKRVDYDKCIKYYFIDNNVAYITCKVTGMDDIISHYSVPGYEILNDEFTAHLERVMEYIPDKYPLVLELTGYHFTEEEQETISNAVWTQFELRFGKAELSRRKNITRIIWFAVSMFLSALLLYYVLDDFSLLIQEVGFVIFWFFGDRLVEYIVIDEKDLQLTKMQTAQILSMKIVFTDRYDDSDLTAKEIEEIKEEVIENVKDEEI